jgi:hypothetical protein
VECCKGVSPTQAAKSRPRLNVSAGGASAAKATAVAPRSAWSGAGPPRRSPQHPLHRSSGA